MKPLHVVGVGNALVDVIARVDDAFLATHEIDKGIMHLIDAPRAVSLYGAMGPATEISGGSAANTIAGLGMLGARAAYVGKVKDDQLGAIFAHDIRSLGVAFDTPPAPVDLQGDETGRCIVLVTPDGERSMNTYLGLSAHLAASDIHEPQIASADWLYLEGYRFDGPDSKQAFAKAIAAAKSAGTRVSITLSDPFCVERHRDEFLRMVRDDVDLLFANEQEIISLYQTDSLEPAMRRAAADCALAAITVSERGCYVVAEGAAAHVPAEARTPVDATGAGDLFAAGFLHGLIEGRDLAACGALGCAAAGEIISHIGARPEQDLKSLFARLELA